jgi:hypothetical protein
MATEQSVRNSFQDIIARLEALKLAATAGDKTPVIPLIDPTANVLSLVAAAIARQDDLRNAEFKRIDDLLKLRAECAHELTEVHLKAQQDLMAAESKRIDAITLAESRRIDALLAAATNNVALASEKAGAQAQTLAASVASSAEALRNQVATTSAATTTLITQVRESLEKRLQIVEQNQFAAGGAAGQRTESRGTSQWAIGIVITVAIVLAQIFTKLLIK